MRNPGYGLERLPDTTEVLRLGALGEAHNLPLVHGEMQRRGPVTSDGIRRAELDAPLPYIESDCGLTIAVGARGADLFDSSAPVECVSSF
jgi:hypothetical protein